ncbi:MAG: hypothetical protein R1F54_06085 [Candidatus Zeuxoniibacter abyssi]|nr:MAG: hypothetical protein R1F54_06085 [Candidatus Persebacteraceae bacterium AB1(2)]
MNCIPFPAVIVRTDRCSLAVRDGSLAVVSVLLATGADVNVVGERIVAESGSVT